MFNEMFGDFEVFPKEEGNEDNGTSIKDGLSSREPLRKPYEQPPGQPRGTYPDALKREGDE